MSKVILSCSYGVFYPNRSLEKLLKTCGFSHWSNIQARTDQRVITYVEKQLNKSKNPFNIAYLGKEKNQFICIQEVDITRPWSISNQDGVEHILYLDYQVVFPELNYYEQSI